MRPSFGGGDYSQPKHRVFNFGMAAGGRLDVTVVLQHDFGELENRCL
jgi:hypothetical protein